MNAMSYGEPPDVPGHCNARLTIADNHGDNHATFVCHQHAGHEGLHAEVYKSHNSGQVTITWEKHDVSFDLSTGEEALRTWIYKLCPEATADYDFDDVEDSDCFLVWVLNKRRIRYVVNGKDSITVGDQTLTVEEAAKLISTKLKG